MQPSVVVAGILMLEFPRNAVTRHRLQTLRQRLQILPLQWRIREHALPQCIQCLSVGQALLSNITPLVTLSLCGHFVAVCRLHGAGCLLSRTRRGSDIPASAGAGRPLGLLAAWLERCPEGLTRWQHVHQFRPSWEQRVTSRADMMRSPGGAHKLLFEKERKRRHGEGYEPVLEP